MSDVPENNQTPNPTPNVPEERKETPPALNQGSSEPVAKVPPPKPVISAEQLHASKQIVTKPITRPEASAADGTDMDRRTFIKWMTLGWAAFAAVLGGYGAMMMRFMFPNVLFEPKQSFRAGYPDEYPIGEVSERFKDKHAVWIVRDSEKIYALSTVCTHLGCTQNWLGNEGKFKCPCHGSGFYKTGINFEGPAPRPLERFKISLGDDGQIVIDKTKKFQQ